MTLEFKQGSRIQVATEFSDPDTGAFVDPGGVVFAFEAPDTTVTTYVFGADAQLIKDAVGQYRVMIDVETPGTWAWRWTSSGNWKGADDGWFYIRPTPVG